MTWLVMQRNVWNDIVSWQTRRLNNSTKYQLHVLMTTTLMWKNWNLKENCQKYAPKCFWNACTWHVLEDLILYCARSITKWTKTCDKRLNRLISYIHQTCDYKKLCCGKRCQTMQIGTVSGLWLSGRSWRFKIHSLLEEHCALLEVIRLFQSVGCVRTKLKFRTVQQNKESFLWTQDWGWMENPHLICGIKSSQFLETRIKVMKNGATCARTFVQHLTNFENERNPMEWLMIWTKLIFFPQASNLLIRKLCCMCLRTMKL